MRRFLIVFMMFGLVAGSVATAEAKKRPAKREARQEAKQKAKQGSEPKRVERTVEGGYKGPYVPFTFHQCHPTEAWGCISVPTRTQEAFVTSAKVTDAHGLPIEVFVYAVTSDWAGGDLYLGTFCGETTEAISFPAGADLTFWVGPHWGARASCPARSAATTGKIRVTLANLR